MPDESTVLPYVTRRIGDREVKFGRLSPRDRGKILARLKAEKKEKLRANLTESGVEKGQVFIELADFDDKRWGGAEFLDYVNNTDGENEVCELAWHKENKGSPEDAWKDLDAISLTEEGARLLDLACEICNYTRADKKPETTDPNPATPAPMDQAATGYGS